MIDRLGGDGLDYRTTLVLLSERFPNGNRKFIITEDGCKLGKASELGWRGNKDAWASRRQRWIVGGPGWERGGRGERGVSRILCRWDACTKKLAR